MLELHSVMRLTKATKIVTAISISLTVFFVGAYALGVSEPVVEDYDYWRERIRSVGPAVAYAELSKKVEQKDAVEQHAAAHIFGGALYFEGGETAFAVCDSRFRFGCLHEFVGRTLREKGIGELTRLNKACNSVFPGNERICRHGIGHGLQSYFGYTRQDLKKALTACDSISEPGSYGGCWGGAFMEYNLRSVLGSEGEIRESEDVIEPCKSVANEHKHACAFWQPQWWNHGGVDPTKFSSSAELYGYLGELCREMFSNEAIRTLCYAGVGSNAVQFAEFDPPSFTTLCNQVSLKDEDVSACVAASAVRFVATGKFDEAREICVSLREEYRESCNKAVESAISREGLTPSR